MPCFPVRGDLALSADQRELVLVAGAALTKQQIEVASTIWQGFWFYDETVGLPMLQSILVKNAQLSTLTQIFRAWLAGISGVVRVKSCGCSLVPAARELRVAFEVECEDGSTLADEVAFALA